MRLPFLGLTAPRAMRPQLSDCRASGRRLCSSERLWGGAGATRSLSGPSVRWQTVLGVLAVVACSGCASLKFGATQELAIATEPAGARCDVARGGEPVGRVDSTPGAVAFPRGATRIEYACTLPGYLEERDVVEILDQDDLQRYANVIRDREAYRRRQSEWDAMSDAQKVAKAAGVAALALGAVAFYAVAYPFSDPILRLALYRADAAIVADPATGFVYGYSLPPVRLVPEHFPDGEARDAFFGERRLHIEAVGMLALDVVDVLYCKPVALDFRCKPPRERAEATRQQRVEALDRQRAATRIVPP